MRPSLEQAIAGIYDAFRDVPRPTSGEGGSPHPGRSDIPVLLSKCLRGLSPADLLHYATSAYPTVGTVGDFLYFVPRILEILASEPGWRSDPEAVARNIGMAGFHSWPDCHRQALLDYFDAVIDELLATEGSCFTLDSWLCALGILHADLTPFLARIAAHRPSLVKLHLLNSPALLHSQLANPLWGEVPEEQRQVIEWLRSAETQAAVRVEYGVE